MFLSLFYLKGCAGANDLVYHEIHESNTIYVIFRLQLYNDRVGRTNRSRVHEGES